MVSYVRQMSICDSILKEIKQALARSGDLRVRQKADKIPTTDAVLRVVSLTPELRTEEGLKDFITGYVLGELNLTAVQREQLDLSKLFPSP